MKYTKYAKLLFSISLVLTIALPAVHIAQSQEGTGTTENPWPMMFGNYMRTGFTDGPAPRTAHLLWKAGPMVGGPPSWGNAIAEGKVFQGTYETGDVYAWDANNGTEIWHTYLNITAYPVMYYEGKIFTSGGSYESQSVTGDEWIALNASTGDIEWIWKIPDTINYVPQNYTAPAGWMMVMPSQPTVYQDKLYLHIFGGIAILDPDDGSVIDYVMGDGTSATHAFYEGKLYGVVSNYTAGTTHGYCLDLTTLQEVWRSAPIPTGTGLKTVGWPVVDGHSVYYTTSDGTITKVDLTTGSLDWTHYPSFRTASAPPETAWGPGPMLAYNRILLGTADGGFYSIDKFTDYTAQWKFQTGGYIYVQGAVADEKIYFGSSDGFVYCIDLSGNLVWKYEIGYPVTGSVGIADGKAYVAANNGYMYCFGPAPPSSISLSAPTSITVGDSSAISGKFEDESGVGIAETDVVLRYRVAPQTGWTEITQLTTASDGSYSYTWTPPYDGYYDLNVLYEEPEIGGYASANATFAMRVIPTAPEVEVDLTPVTDTIGDLEGSVDDLEGSIGDLESTISALTTYLIVIVVLVIISIGIIVYVAYRTRT